MMSTETLFSPSKGLIPIEERLTYTIESSKFKYGKRDLHLLNIRFTLSIPVTFVSRALSNESSVYDNIC